MSTMSDTIEIRIPNIGDFHDLPIVAVLVKAGDAVELESPLVELESEKATMEVPSPREGHRGKASPSSSATKSPKA